MPELDAAAREHAGHVLTIRMHDTQFELQIAPDGRTLPAFNETWRADLLRHLDR